MLERGQFINGQWRDLSPERAMPVLDKFSGETIASVAAATIEEVADAVSAAETAFETDELTPSQRSLILRETCRLVARESEPLARTLVREVGKTIREARVEVANAVVALENAAEEAKRVMGEMVPIDANSGLERRLAFTLRMPAGPVCAITPFNSPFNIAVHKCCSAIAAGNSVVVKPSEHTPLTTIRLAELMTEAGLPPGHLNLVYGAAGVGASLCADPRFARYSFTGGHEAGRRVAAAVGVRPLTLELGPAGPTFIHHDADLDQAVRRSVAAAYGIAGQVCTSVQRLYVHEAVFGDVMSLLVPLVEALRLGDPMDELTDVGPVLLEAAAARAEGWLNEALAQGAEVVTGGSRRGRMFEPTVVTGVTSEMNVFRSEAFAPLLCVVPYSDLVAEVRRDNKISGGGLQAGIFTRDLVTAFAFARTVRAGGIMVNDTSRFRVANMPFGGTGKAGYGKEGPHYAIREMTDARTVVLHL